MRALCHRLNRAGHRGVCLAFVPRAHRGARASGPGALSLVPGPLAFALLLLLLWTCVCVRCVLDLVFSLYMHMYIFLYVFLYIYVFILKYLCI